jgi:hypothetical protein
MVTETDYRGALGSDQECRQVSEFEFDNRELFSVPEYVLNDSSGIGTQIWGKAINDNETPLAANTWTSVMEGFRHGAGGGAVGDVFGNDRELNLVVLAGDVPRSGGERYPWLGGINDEDRDEILRVIGSGRNVNLVLLIYAPNDIDTGLHDTDERAAAFSRDHKAVAANDNSDSGIGKLNSFVQVYHDEDSFLSEGLDLVRGNSGRIVLRRLQ